MHKGLILGLMRDISGPAGSTHLHITSIFHIDCENIFGFGVVVLCYFVNLSCSGKDKKSYFPSINKLFDKKHYIQDYI